MTRKDYKLIARALNALQSRPTIVQVVEALSAELAAQNPKFDKEKFFSACTRDVI